MNSHGNEIAIFAKKLADRKFSISTIGWILFFEGGKLSKKDFALLMEGKDIRKADLYDLERANAFLENNPDHKRRLINSYNGCLERKIFNNEIYVN